MTTIESAKPSNSKKANYLSMREVSSPLPIRAAPRSWVPSASGRPSKA